MPVPSLTAVRLGGRPDQPLLVLGPAPGAAARDLWARAAERLAADFQVVAWDLPGHGTNPWTPEPGEEPTVADLARGVLAVVDEMQDGFVPPAFHHAGGSVGGAVGLRLLLDAPGRVRSATLLGGDHAAYDEMLAELGDELREGRVVVLDGVASPDEAPDDVARQIRAHVLGEPATRSREGMTVAEVREAGTAVRREVLGGAFVARANRQATEFTRDFQEFVAEYAWGGVWTRPGLDHRTRSVVALTALVAGGHHDLLAEHVRGARATGLTVEEIREVLLQTAVYCGLPAADAAFRVAQRVLHELGEA